MTKRNSRWDRLRWDLILLLVAAFAFGAMPASGQDTAFTYQGQLRRSGNPAQGRFDLQFRLWNADGIEGIGAPVSVSLVRTVMVTNGMFTTQLDFGPAPFSGALLWMEMGVRTNGASAFTPLAPRQPLTATPYAVRAAFYGGPIAESQLPATIARLDQPWQSTNTVVLDNLANVFAGTLSGTGAFTGGLSVGAAGTPLRQVLHGSAVIGDSTGGVKTVTIPFPAAFMGVPRVTVTARGAIGSEVFGVTTRTVSGTQFEVNVLRLDVPGAAWAQPLQLDWLAWE